MTDNTTQTESERRETARRMASAFLTSTRAAHAQFMSDSGPEVPDFDEYLTFAGLTEEDLFYHPITPVELEAINACARNYVCKHNGDMLINLIDDSYASLASTGKHLMIVALRRAVPYALYAACRQAAAAKHIADAEFSKFRAIAAPDLTGTEIASAP